MTVDSDIGDGANVVDGSGWSAMVVVETSVSIVVRNTVTVRSEQGVRVPFCSRCNHSRKAIHIGRRGAFGIIFSVSAIASLVLFAI